MLKRRTSVILLKGVPMWPLSMMHWDMGTPRQTWELGTPPSPDMRPRYPTSDISSHHRIHIQTCSLDIIAQSPIPPPPQWLGQTGDMHPRWVLFCCICVNKSTNTVSVKLTGRKMRCRQKAFDYFAQYYYHPQRSWGKVIFSEACVKNSVHRWETHGRGRTWQGTCMAGGACMVGGLVWWVACVVGDVHGKGHAWQGGMHGRGDMCGRYYEIWSMSRPCASYWNAFLFYHDFWIQK